MNLDGSSNDYRQVESLFQRALDLAADQRADFLEAQCNGNQVLLRDVETLLRHHAAVPETYLNPLVDQSGPLSAHVEPPRRIGRYEILRLIGEGGMGAVFEARQENPRRSVAIKIIRSPLATPESVRRFEYEAEILGRLRHPGIAHVYEAGVSDMTDSTGRSDRKPYFAMELIDGLPLQQFLRAAPDLRPRVELFVQICEAVEHAHQKGVIHRDLKPGNILVTADGQPKILDFGVARGTDSDALTTTMHTQAAQVLGTLPYMSPEQVGGRVDQLDTRSDVYSLGVILYEMLTGRLPYDLSGKNLVAAARIISEQAPAALPEASAAAGGTGIPARQLRGDLETIVRKALEKDALRRYPSVHALAADVRRYLNREPISARPASALYQLRRFAQRHTALVTAVLIAMLALLLGLIGTGYGLLRAKDALAQADERSRQLESVAKFQAAQLADIDVGQMGVRLRGALLEEAQASMLRSKFDAATVAARTAEVEQLLDGSNFTNLALKMLDQNIFDRALSAIETEFPDQPLVRARLLHTAAHTLRELGMFERGLAPQQEALRIWRDVLGEDDRHTLSAVNNLGHHLHAMGKLAEAEPHLRSAVEGYRRTLGNEHDETLSAITNLGALLRDRRETAEAEPLYVEALATRERVLGADHPSTLTSYNNIGSMLSTQGKRAEAIVYYRKALEGRRRVLGNEHLLTLHSLMNLGNALVSEGEFAEAEPLLREALESGRTQRGDEHPDTLAALFFLGSALREKGRIAEAEPLAREALDGRRRILGSDHNRTLQALGLVAAVLKDQGKPSEAEVLFREALERSQRVFGEDHPGTIAWTNCVGQALMDQNKPAEAEGYYRAALERRRRVLGPTHQETLPSINNVGTALMAQDKLSEAEPFLVEAVQVSRRVLGDDNPTTLAMISNLGRLLRRLGRLDEAESLGAEAVQRAKVKLPAGHWSSAGYLYEHAITLAKQKRFTEAEAEMMQAHEGLSAALGPGHPRTIKCIDGIAAMYDDWHATEPAVGHDKKAAEWRARLDSTEPDEPRSQ